MRGRSPTRLDSLPQPLIFHLLNPLCEKLSLVPLNCFSLLESFFSEFPNKFHFTMQIYYKLEQIELQLQQFHLQN